MIIASKCIIALSLFIDKRSNRIELSGLNFNFNNPNYIVMTASDGHKLCSIKVDADDHGLHGSFTSPIDIFKSIKGDIDVEFSDEMINIKYGNVSMSEDLITQPYPDFKKVIPNTVSDEISNFNVPNMTIALKAKNLLFGEKNEVLEIFHNGTGPAIVNTGNDNIFMMLSPVAMTDVGEYNNPDWI